jgi:hypothetical protein
MPNRTVLLADLSPLLGDIVTASLATRSDVQVVRRTLAGQDLLAAAVAESAQVVIVARCDPSDLDALDPAFTRAATISVLALAENGAWACLHQLRPDMSRFDDISAATLASVALTGIGPEA